MRTTLTKRLVATAVPQDKPYELPRFHDLRHHFASASAGARVP